MCDCSARVLASRDKCDKCNKCINCDNTQACFPLRRGAACRGAELRRAVAIGGVCTQLSRDALSLSGGAGVDDDDDDALSAEVQDKERRRASFLRKQRAPVHKNDSFVEKIHVKAIERQLQKLQAQLDKALEADMTEEQKASYRERKANQRANDAAGVLSTPTLTTLDTNTALLNIH